MAKHKYIKSPDQLWDMFQDYKNITKSKPILKHVFVGRNGDSKYEERERPLTLDGFENYVADIDGMPMHLADYFANTNDKYSEFSSICSRIRRAIRSDQIEGGMASIYNPSITQRLNNLTERTDITSGDKKINLPPFMRDDENES